jgi:hypothetical protein
VRSKVPALTPPAPYPINSQGFQIPTPAHTSFYLKPFNNSGFFNNFKLSLRPKKIEIKYDEEIQRWQMEP